MPNENNNVLNLKKQKVTRFLEGVLKEHYYGIPNKHKYILNSDEMNELLEQITMMNNKNKKY